LLSPLFELFNNKKWYQASSSGNRPKFMSHSEALPEGWVSKESKSRPGVTYYWNTVTKSSSWEKPTHAAVHVKKKRKKDHDADGEQVQVDVQHTSSFD
jgi:hypothetical protein